MMYVWVANITMVLQQMRKYNAYIEKRMKKMKVKTTKYMRVVGYMGKVDDMNEGKQAEAKARLYMVQ
jgi:hypothetical protein